MVMRRKSFKTLAVVFFFFIAVIFGAYIYAAPPPTISIINPRPGYSSAPAVVSSWTSSASGSFKMQVQVWSTVGLNAPVKVGYYRGTNPDTGWFTDVTAIQNTNYNCGTNCGIYDAALTGLPWNTNYYLYAWTSSVEGIGESRQWRTGNDARYFYVRLLPSNAGTGMILGRDSSSQLCMDCHQEVLSHSSQQISEKYQNWQTVCLECHTPHNTRNLYLIRDKISTPNSGWRTVKLFNTTGDSVNSYVNAADWSTTKGVCQVCHTQTQSSGGVARWKSGWNSDSHYTAASGTQRCTSCHTHTAGFAGAESGGGVACGSCHADLYGYMNGASNYHHYMNNENASYGTVAQPALMGGSSDVDRNCLMCHVDHDIFRPDINAANGGRGRNLRANISAWPTVGDTNTYANTDFINDAARNGGICISCHSTSQSNPGYVQPDWTTFKPQVPYGDTMANQVSVYNASAHQYAVVSQYNGSLMNTFGANCSKCHSDTLSPKSNKSAQISTNKFGNHQSTLRRITAALGITSPTDPLEENFCYRCHSKTSDPTPGGGPAKSTSLRDYYDNANMSAASEDIFGVFTTVSKPYKHNVGGYSGLHKPSSADETLTYISNNKHVECEDCHNPHATAAGNHGWRTNAVSPVLRGASGAITTFSYANWRTVWSAPIGYNLAKADKEYEICFKCHSSANTNPSGWNAANISWITTTGPTAWTNVGLEFSPNNRSGHPIARGLTWYSNSVAPRALAATQLLAPWNVNMGNQTMYCTDCHYTNSAVSKGPHGSSVKWMLWGSFRNWPYTSVSRNGWGSGTYAAIVNAVGEDNTFCHNCHPKGANNVHTAHSGQGISPYCVACHIRVPHGGKVSRLITANTAGLPRRYFPNGNAGDYSGSDYILRFEKASTPTGYLGAGEQCNAACYASHNNTTNPQW